MERVAFVLGCIILGVQAIRFLISLGRLTWLFIEAGMMKAVEKYEEKNQIAKASAIYFLQEEFPLQRKQILTSLFWQLISVAFIAFILAKAF